MIFFKSKRKIVIASICAVVVIVLFSACAIYLNDFYRADIDAISEFLPEGTSWKEEPDGTVVFMPDEATKGLIFYPGGKVEHIAYIPLMQACADRGILCVLVEMPFNLAVFDVNAADGIIQQYPEIDGWYIGGHSLGGSMAASYLSDKSDDYKGLVLLGSYSATDISDTVLKVLSVYGSEDTVLNTDKYKENKSNLPNDFNEVLIDGGCHAYFGMYGNQDGDGTPSITNAEQINITADAIESFVEQ